MKTRSTGLLLLLLSLTTAHSFAQDWLGVSESSIPVTGQRDIIPNVYLIYQTDPDEIKDMLWSAPHEYAQDVVTSNVMIRIALADGTVDYFRMVKYDMMEAELAASYPNIKTFRGVSISNPYRSIRADWTTEGFRAMIRDENGSTFIDPFQRNDLSHRIVYYKRDYNSIRAWDCGVTDGEIVEEENPSTRVFGDCVFRSYRLALATTGEYSNFFGATTPAQSALVLSQVVTAVNRVNEVYEKDITVRLILIGNTTAVFYYDPAGDPFSGDACTQLNQNQTNMTSVIGGANYDIGHVFSIGSGGCAGLGVICSASNKARGATGLNPPTGDPFYIDYVAHEMGHQFGGDHTFNGTAGSCNGNRVPASAYEPGSGTTIMAYAGICGAQDVQPHSDAYFHARSLLQITTVLSGTSCAATITLNNTAPVAGSPPNYTIPRATPFVLTATATDPENDPMTFCWEEYDLEATSTEPPNSKDIDGPLFRSITPTTSPSRYFPKISDIVNNTTTIWEVLPDTNRTMNYRMTVRDYHSMAGCTDEDDVLVTVTTTSGPFVVTSQNAASTWNEGTMETITWNVANTTAAPVSCANVEIRLSLDGGFTYPTVLAASETNDGSATVTIPAGTTTMGRVMVKGLNKIFFDINNANITILANLPTFLLSLNPATISECNDGSVQTIVNVTPFMGYTDPVTMSIINLPPGAIANFNPVVVTPGSSSMLTISNLAGLMGTYTSTIKGTSTVGVKQTDLTTTLYTAAPVMITTLVSPANNASNAVINPLLDWTAVSGVNQYEYQLAYDNAFANIATGGIASTDQFQFVAPLLVSQQYYWRVRSVNPCGSSAWSSVFNFTTGSCASYNSLNVPVPITSVGTPIITSTLTFPLLMTITDVNVINLTGTHTWIDDLKFSLISPQSTERLIWNQPCSNQDNFNINLDDEAANNNWPCPPVDGLTYKPDNTLSIFDGQQASGIWTMKVQDVANDDGGSLNSWGVKVCGTIACQLIVNQTSGNGVGSLGAAVSCAMPGDTILISSQLTGQTINIGANAIPISKNLVILAQGPNTNITSSGTRVFDINSGIQAELNGMIITAGSSMTGGAISNSGTLKLKNATIEKNDVVIGATLIQNNPGGSLQVLGSCYINQ